jgi:hypothetical protein
MLAARSSRCSWLCAAGAILLIGCDTPSTTVSVGNAYPPAAVDAYVLYRAFWQAVSFPTPIAPGASSDAQDTVAASANTAYAVVAPGWDATTGAAPTQLIVLQSRAGFEVHWNTTLHIPVDDDTFAGDCAAGSVLAQADADFITQRVFASAFAGLHYDAATCTTTGEP